MLPNPDVISRFEMRKNWIRDENDNAGTHGKSRSFPKNPCEFEELVNLSTNPRIPRALLPRKMADQKRVGAFVQSNIWNVMDGETRPDKARTVILKVVVLHMHGDYANKPSVYIVYKCLYHTWNALFNSASSWCRYGATLFV